MPADKLTVYTTVFGYTDPLHDSTISSDALFLCLTDNPRLKSNFWTVVYIGPVKASTHQSRLVKALSHEYTHTEWSLWVDCNFILRCDPLLLLPQGELVTFRHAKRSSLREEATAVIRQRKARLATVRAQLLAYEAEGFPVDTPLENGLSSTGVTLRRHTHEVCRLNQLWSQQLERYTLRDQLCVDYVAWKTGLGIGRWPGNIDSNPHFRYRPYRRPVMDY